MGNSNMVAGVCIIFLLGTLPFVFSVPEALDTVNINFNLGEGTNTDYADQQDTDGSDYQEETDVSICYKDDLIFNGFLNVISQKHAATAQDCSLTCCKTYRCMGWTYKKSSKICWLKGLIRKPDFISGRKDCQLPPSEEESSQDYRSYRGYGSKWLIQECNPEEINAHGFCYLDNAHLEENISPFEENVQPTAQDCQKSCHNTTNCKYWSYRKSTKTCFLKNPPKNIGFISGEKSCAVDL